MCYEGHKFLPTENEIDKSDHQSIKKKTKSNVYKMIDLYIIYGLIFVGPLIMNLTKDLKLYQ